MSADVSRSAACGCEPIRRLALASAGNPMRTCWIFFLFLQQCKKGSTPFIHFPFLRIKCPDLTAPLKKKTLNKQVKHWPRRFCCRAKLLLAQIHPRPLHWLARIPGEGVVLVFQNSFPFVRHSALCFLLGLNFLPWLDSDCKIFFFFSWNGGRRKVQPPTRDVLITFLWSWYNADFIPGLITEYRLLDALQNKLDCFLQRSIHALLSINILFILQIEEPSEHTINHKEKLEINWKTIV